MMSSSLSSNRSDEEMLVLASLWNHIAEREFRTRTAHSLAGLIVPSGLAKLAKAYDEAKSSVEAVLTRIRGRRLNVKFSGLAAFSDAGFLSYSQLRPTLAIRVCMRVVPSMDDIEVGFALVRNRKVVKETSFFTPQHFYPNPLIQEVLSEFEAGSQLEVSPKGNRKDVTVLPTDPLRALEFIANDHSGIRLQHKNAILKESFLMLPEQTFALLHRFVGTDLMQSALKLAEQYYQQCIVTPGIFIIRSEALSDAIGSYLFSMNPALPSRDATLAAVKFFARDERRDVNRRFEALIEFTRRLPSVVGLTGLISLGQQLHLHRTQKRTHQVKHKGHSSRHISELERALLGVIELEGCTKLASDVIRLWLRPVLSPVSMTGSRRKLVAKLLIDMEVAPSQASHLLDAVSHLRLKREWADLIK